MSATKYRLRRSEDMKSYLIDNQDQRTGGWTARLQYSTFAAAEGSLMTVLSEEARMDELNAGLGTSPHVAGLEKQIADLKAEIESMRKLYEE